MPKTLKNYLRDRNKFSFKAKKRQPIVQRDKDMTRCGLHDDDRKRACIGPGCRTHDEKAARRAGACGRAPCERARAPPPEAAAELRDARCRGALVAGKAKDKDTDNKKGGTLPKKSAVTNPLMKSWVTSGAGEPPPSATEPPPSAPVLSG